MCNRHTLTPSKHRYSSDDNSTHLSASTDAAAAPDVTGLSSAAPPAAATDSQQNRTATASGHVTAATAANADLGDSHSTGGRLIGAPARVVQRLQDFYEFACVLNNIKSER